MLGNAVLLGPESGAPMVFIALAAAARSPCSTWGNPGGGAGGVLFAVVCFVVAESDLLA